MIWAWIVSCLISGIIGHYIGELRGLRFALSLHDKKETK